MAAEERSDHLEKAATETQARQPAEEGKVPSAQPRDNLPLLDDTPVLVQIELGRTRTTLAEALSLGEQSLIELDRQVGDLVDIRVNGKLLARGEVVTVSEYFGVRITEIVDQA